MAELSNIDDPAALLAGLFSHAPVGFQIYTADGYSVLTNPKFREIFGSEPPPGYNALRDEQAAQVGVLALIQRAFAGETVTIPAFWYDPRDVAHVHVAEGRRVAIEITAFPLRGRDGRVSHVAMVHKDVTADLLAQAERAALTQRFEMILDRMPIGCILYDAEFRFVYWNKATERIFGYRFEEVRGRQPFGLITPASAQPLVEGFFRELAAGRREVDATAENMTRDGRKILCEWHDMPLHDAENRFSGILAMCQDVSERRATEERLRHSEKMNAVGQLTGGVAHDFNNLLTVVIGSLDLAMDRVQQELRPSIEGTLRAAERGAALVRQMLAFSRRQTLISETLDLNGVAAGMEQMLRRTLGERRDRDAAGAAAVVGVGRPGAGRERAAEPGHQRTRCHAGRRQADHRDRQRPSRRGLRRRQRRSGARRLCRARGDGHRDRYVAGGSCTCVRALLHDQGGRQGHRPRAQHDLRLRQAIAGPCEDL
jgi:PAS domain S-box-containing protein